MHYSIWLAGAATETRTLSPPTKIAHRPVHYKTGPYHATLTICLSTSLDTGRFGARVLVYIKRYGYIEAFDSAKWKWPRA